MGSQKVAQHCHQLFERIGKLLFVDASVCRRTFCAGVAYACYVCVSTPELHAVFRSLRWHVGVPFVQQQISLTPGITKVDHATNIGVQMRIPGYVPSGVKVNRLDITCEVCVP